MPLPEIPTQDTGAPNPVEALPAPVGEARGAAVASGFESSLGVSLETQAIGKAAGGTQFVPYDDAKSIMEKNGYDPNVLPAGGLSNTELNAIMNQQSSIKRNDAIVQQSSLSKFTGGALRMLGGAGDPIFIAAGPVLGRLGFAVKGMGIGGRLAAGAAEGGTVNAGYDVALKHFGTAPGDADIGTQQIVTDALVGGLVGGSLHGAFGPRAPVPQGGNYLSMIETAENTAGYAKAHGISENDVVSSAGAVGKYQVTPGTARQYGFDPNRLTDPAYNREAATAILDDLHKRFGDDPEAIAVGYNAGPGRAREFVKAGHDRAMLPKETRDYLARIDRAGGREAFGLARAGVYVESTASQYAGGSSGERGIHAGMAENQPADTGTAQKGHLSELQPRPPQEGEADTQAMSAVRGGGADASPGLQRPADGGMALSEASPGTAPGAGLRAPLEAAGRATSEVAASADRVTAAYSHAYAAAAADSLTDISSEYRTNPFRIADEHAAEITQLETEAMQRAFGRPTVTPGTIDSGSVFTQDPAAKAILSQPPPERVGASPKAEFADLAQSAADAVHEAEQAHALTSAGKAVDLEKFARESGLEITRNSTEPTRLFGTKADGKVTPSRVNLNPDQLKDLDIKEQAALSHEIGHAITAKLGGVFDMVMSGPEGLHAELEKAAKGMFPESAYRQRPDEMTADAIGRWLIDPESRAKMPLLTKMLGGNEETASLLQEHLDAAEDAAHAEGYSPDMVKAIHAAVRCAMVKGLG